MVTDEECMHWVWPGSLPDFNLLCRWLLFLLLSFFLVLIDHLGFLYGVHPDKIKMAQVTAASTAATLAAAMLAAVLYSSKNSSKVFQAKKLIQVDANCDEFPVSLIPVVRLYSLSDKKGLFEWTLIVMNFRFLYPWLYRRAPRTWRIRTKFGEGVQALYIKYCTAYLHKRLLHTCPP